MTSRVLEWEFGALNLGPATVAVGVFDGVHVGHQALISDAVERARARDVLSCVMTFDRDPDQVLTPDAAAPQLLTIEDKLAAITELGVETVVVVPFCRLVAEMAPDRFVSDVLADALQPVEVIVGRDFRFGRYASGTVATLEHYGAEHGFGVVAHDLVCRGGEPVTSTRIRNLVVAGDVVARTRTARPTASGARRCGPRAGARPEPRRADGQRHTRRLLGASRERRLRGLGHR